MKLLMIDSYEVLGFVAAVLTTAAFVPQVYKTWKTKSVESLSLTMYIGFFIGIMLWLIYGIHLNSLPMTLANSITGFLALMLIYFKFKYK